MLEPGHNFRDVMADNVWPDEVPGFKETFLELFQALANNATTAGPAIAPALPPAAMRP